MIMLNKNIQNCIKNGLLKLQKQKEIEERNKAKIVV